MLGHQVQAEARIVVDLLVAEHHEGATGASYEKSGMISSILLLVRALGGFPYAITNFFKMSFFEAKYFFLKIMAIFKMKWSTAIFW